MEIKNLSQKKEEEEATIQQQNQSIIIQSFSHKIYQEEKGKKTEMLMSKPAYLGLLILVLSKILMYQFWYEYVKPNYGEKSKMCYMDTDM